MLPATTSIVRAWNDYSQPNRIHGEAREYVRSEWNGDGAAVSAMITRVGREKPVVGRPTWAQRALRKVAGIADALEAVFSQPSGF
ncbi:MAG TPA: hypothetical protein VIB49_02500 [Thermoplasmata archaeon]|jgi:hypothetical protein